MGFSSYKLLLILNVEITENFYSWDNRSACPPNLIPPKKNGDCILVMRENSNAHLVPHLSDEPNQGTLVFPSGLSS